MSRDSHSRVWLHPWSALAWLQERSKFPEECGNARSALAPSWWTPREPEAQPQAAEPLCAWRWRESPLRKTGMGWNLQHRTLIHGHFLSPALECRCWAEPNYFSREKLGVFLLLFCGREIMLRLEAQHNCPGWPPSAALCPGCVLCRNWMHSPCLEAVMCLWAVEGFLC